MKSAFVTGTSKGLGLELARGLLAQGYRVLGVSRSDCSIEHENYHHLTADITDTRYPQALGEFIERYEVRHVDLAINNAGIRSHGSDIESVQAAEVMRQFNLHCIGVLSTVQALASVLDRSKIVNITSRLGSVKFNQRGDFAGREFSYGYRIAKAAQNMLSLCLATDEKLSGNAVISIIPGLLRTESGADDASHSAVEGGKAVLDKIFSVETSGVYHAFEDEVAY
ncbi:MAG: SDR family NAD(P)-dependent oxidoreductase [Gammaproteobacteria bacterium]|nr:SDR family NAD(P)-dependent oxidoreductase [Gammaproteobacteria bacterium]